MVATCLALLAVSLSSGNVVLIAPGTPLVEAGRYRWALRDRPFVVATDTRAIVIRLSPEGVPGLVEVKVFDGTNRLCWLEAVSLLALPWKGPAREVVVSISLPGQIGTQSRSRYETDFRKKSRRAQEPSFRAIDAAMASMWQAVLTTQGPDLPGPIMVVPEVFGTPVFNTPVFRGEVFGTPLVGTPVFGMELFGTPVVGTPLVDTPVFGTPIF